MSASEKLKMLKPDRGDLDWGRGTIALWDALPQLVATVKAAEEARPYEHEPTASYVAETIPEDRMIRLRLALAELEKALS